MVGSRLKDRFHILKRIAKGGFGETFLAQDTHNMNNPCVVKRLLTQSDPSVQKLFDLEAKKLYNLKHDGIPKLIAYFEDGGQFYLVQDFVDGHTLNQEINSTTKWTESQVIDFLLEALEILAYVHSQGSIHRDLKPDNMMRRHADHKLVMIDFGAVREVRQTPSNMAIGAASFAQTVIGTKGYMPAEQAHGEPQFASDVYAMGCIAIYALTGVSPENFEKDRYEIRWRHLVRVSNGLGVIVDKMVRYDVRDRYVNAGEVLTPLKALSNRNKPVIPNPPPVIPVTVNPPITPPNSANKTPYVSRPNPPAPSTRRKFIIGLAVATPLAIVAWDWWKPKGNPSIPSTADSGKPSANPISTAPETPRSSQNEPTPPSPTPTPASLLQTQTLSNIITVDSSGKEINRRTVQVQYFVEDKISLPSGAVPLEMALIPKGKFTMGSPSSEKDRSSDESPQHEVNFPQDFYMGRYAVTQAQWKTVMGNFTDAFNKAEAKFKGDNRPMIYVSWHEAREFCKRISSNRGTYRLPTEAEWEYACRAGTTTPFHFGETITPKLANYDWTNPYANAPKEKEYPQKTVDVNNFDPNAWGLYQMHGNVSEWCLDEYVEYNKKSSNLRNNGSEPYGDMNVNNNDNRSRVVRSGSWFYNAFLSRSALRIGDFARGQSFYVGFRVILASFS